MAANIFFRPVIPLLLSLIAGIATGNWLPGHKIPALCVILLGITTILVVIIKSNASRIAPIVLFGAVGYLSIQPWLTPQFPPSHIIHFIDTHPWEITGVVDTHPAATGNRLKFVLQAETLGEKKSSFPVAGKIRVTVSGSSTGLSKGDRVFLTSRIRSIRNFNNPGGFDYKRYMAFKGIWATAYVSEEKLIILPEHASKRAGWFIDAVRGRLSALIEKTTPAKPKGVLKALIIGDKNAIAPPLREAFNRTGVGHLLAISGLHIGIVATCAFLLFTRLLAYCRFLLWHAWHKKAAVMLSVIPVCVYGLLAGMSPSTQRAVIMVVVFLLSFLFEREHDLMNTLALAALLILIVHPPALFSISFQLSFAAVLAIIYGFSRVHNPWTPAPGGRKKPALFKIKRKLFYFFAVSFFAIIGTMPLIMLYFNQISLVGFLVNIMVVPVIGFIVVPLGLLAVFLLPFTVAGASFLLKVCTTVLTPALAIVNFFSGLPYAAVKTVTPTLFEIGLFYLLFWALLNLKRASPGTQNEGQHVGPSQGLFSSVHRSKLAFIMITVIILAAIVDTLYWCNRRLWHDDLRVTAIDVGHGGSTLLELPGGYTMLIDGGGFSDNTIFDVGARIVAPLLWRKKIKTVDTLILSHPNSDHLNGLIYIAEHFNVKDVWTNNQTANTVGYNNFMTTLKFNKIHMPVFKRLSRCRKINGVRLGILYPPVDFSGKSKRERWRDPNNNSLVVKVTLGSVSFLFTGDIKARAETELVAMVGNRVSSTVLVAPHHGSKTSSTPAFLNSVNPDIAIISSGWNSRFGFPHQPVLERYRARGIQVFETARHGAIGMTTDGRSLTIRPTIIEESM